MSCGLAGALCETTLVLWMNLEGYSACTLSICDLLLKMMFLRLACVKSFTTLKQKNKYCHYFNICFLT